MFTTNLFRHRTQQILALADVQIDGSRPWDIQVHNDGFYSRVLTQGSMGLGDYFGGAGGIVLVYSLACPRIEIIQAATKFASETPILTEQPKSNGRGEIKLPSPIFTSLSFGEVVRARRSALDFRGGEESICFKQLATLLASTGKPLFADFAAQRFVQLYLYVHRVEGLTPGVYRYWEDNAELEQIMQGDHFALGHAVLDPRLEA